MPPEGVTDAEAAAQICVAIAGHHVRVEEMDGQANGDTPQEARDDGRRPVGELVQGVVGMDHPEVPVHSHHGEEDDAALPVHGQHEEHQTTGDVSKPPIPPFDIVVHQEGQADDEEKVSHRQVEQENPAGFPGLEMETENPQGKAIAQEPEHKLQPQHRRQDFGNVFISEHTAVLAIYRQKVVLFAHEWSCPVGPRAPHLAKAQGECVCLCGERVVQPSALCHVRVLKEMTAWLPGNYEIT